MCVSLLFCRLSVSREFKFSKTKGGNTLILKKGKKKREREENVAVYDARVLLEEKYRFLNEIIEITGSSAG